MKTRTFLKYTLIATSLLSVAAFQAVAQPGPGPGGPGGGGGGFGGGGGRGFPGMANMTDDERAAFMEMSTNAAVADLQAKLMEARTSLANAIYADKVDEAAIKDKAAAAAKIDADLSVARAKAFDAVRSKFKPETVDMLKQMGARGGGGGFGGRGGGMGGGARRGGGGGGGGNN